MSKIVFVCTGNTCRSPMAEALAKSIFESHGLDIIVRSAGVSTGDGYPASENAIAAMLEENIDLQAHKSTQISREILADASLVLTMTKGHLSEVRSICPEASAFTLGEYAMTDSDISDPFGDSLEVYRECAAQIKELIMVSLSKIKMDCGIN